MKKTLYATVLVLLTVAGIYGMRYKLKQNELRIANNNKWTVDQIDNFLLFDMPISNDTLITDALQAFLTKKIEDGYLKGSISIHLSSSDLHFDRIKNLEIKLLNDSTSYTDTLSFANLEKNEADCILELSLNNIKNTNSNAEATLIFLQDIFTKKNLKAEIRANIGDGYMDWTKATISQ